MSETQGHLNDDQFTGLMLGLDPAPSAAAHLAACPRCREEMASFRGSVDNLAAAGLAWSQTRQPAWSPRAAAAASAGRRPRVPVVAAWALAGCAAISLAVFPTLHHRAADIDSATNTSASMTLQNPSENDTEAQIAQDNQLMHEVTLAIGSGEPSPYNEYGLDTGRSAAGPGSGLRTRSE